MLIREFSDIHWEHDWSAQHKTRLASEPYPEYWMPVELPTDENTYLFLAGDLFNGVRSIDIIERFSKRFKKIFIVLGNHDYWGKMSLYDVKYEYMTQLVSRFVNVELLDRNCFEIEGKIIVGATLWTDMKKGSPAVEAIARFAMGADFGQINMGTYFDEHYMNRIIPFTPTSWMVENKKDFEYIKHVVENNKDKEIIVATHHAPTMLSIHESFKNYGDSNYFFASDYSEFILDNPHIKLWMHGHVHSPFDYMLGETRVVCNPRGYPNEVHSRNFSNTNLIEV